MLFKSSCEKTPQGKGREKAYGAKKIALTQSLLDGEWRVRPDKMDID